MFGEHIPSKVCIGIFIRIMLMYLSIMGEEDFIGRLSFSGV